MGEGFVVLQSNDVDIYYYQDEPGMFKRVQIQMKSPLLGPNLVSCLFQSLCEFFLVLSCSDISLLVFCPGLVPTEQESTEEAETSSEGDQLQDLPPCWGLDIVCGKGTDFNYGPWADRQR